MIKASEAAANVSLGASAAGKKELAALEKSIQAASLQGKKRIEYKVPKDAAEDVLRYIKAQLSEAGYLCVTRQKPTMGGERKTLLEISW